MRKGSTQNTNIERSPAEESAFRQFPPTVPFAERRRADWTSGWEAAERAMQTKVSEEHRLRYLLWIRHGHDGLYGDDGEMQCAQCRLDFKRDPAERIMARFGEMGRAAPAAEPTEEN